MEKAAVLAVKPAAKSRIVLVVDSDASARSDICSLLELECYQTFEASSAEEALAPIKSRVPFFAIICEAKLRGHDGLWLYDQAQSLLPQIKFILVNRKEFDPKGRTVTAILRKPVNLQQLLKLLAAP